MGMTNDRPTRGCGGGSLTWGSGAPLGVWFGAPSGASIPMASTQVLAFVGRRLQAESVGVVLAARRAGDEVADLPQLVLEGLREDDAHALLDSVLAGPLDARVRDRFVAETRGNPLALLVLPLGLTPAQLGGGFGFTGFEPLSGRIERAFQRRVETLPAQTRRLLA